MRVATQSNTASVKVEDGSSDRTADGELSFKQEISPLTVCYVGCELPFSSDPGFCLSPFTVAAVDLNSPWRQRGGHGGSWAVLLPHANRRPAGWHVRAGAN